MECDYYCTTHGQHSHFDCVECVKAENDIQVKELSEKVERLWAKNRRLEEVMYQFKVAGETYKKAVDGYRKITQTPNTDKETN